MASLPPRPALSPPPIEREERRYDDRDRRNLWPMTSRYHSERRPDIYVPRSRPDVYMPPERYERREDNFRRDDRFRERERRDRDRSRERQRGYLDTWQPRSREDDRFRLYERDRNRRFDSRRDSRSPRRDNYGPPRRTSHSPSKRRSPRPRGSTRSRSRSLSPPPEKRLKLDKPSQEETIHSLQAGSEVVREGKIVVTVPSLSAPSGHPLPMTSVAPESGAASSSIKMEESLPAELPVIGVKESTPTTNMIVTEHTPSAPNAPPHPKSIVISPSSQLVSQPASHSTISTLQLPETKPPENHTSPVQAPLPPSLHLPHVTPKTESPMVLPLVIQAEPHYDQEGDRERDIPLDIKMRERSHSPPKQPRRPPGPIYGPPLIHPSPRSPPRGPRAGYKPTTGSAGMPSSLGPYPTGPRVVRRPHPLGLDGQDLSPAHTPGPLSSSAPENQLSDPIQQFRSNHPDIAALINSKTAYFRPFEPDTSLKTSQQRLARLVSEHAVITRELRRALHELDTSTIDLRAAESRRKYAEVQMERARSGILAMDIPPPSNPNEEANDIPSPVCTTPTTAPVTTTT